MNVPLRGAVGWIGGASALVPALLVLSLGSTEAVFFGFGPADGDYVEGFRVGWARGTTARWSRERALVDLPFRVRGDAELVVLGGRPERAPAEITVSQGERILDRMTVGERTAPYAFTLVEGEALFRFDSARADAGHGLRLEGLRIVPREWGAIAPDFSSVARSALATLAFALAGLAAGFSARSSALLTLALLGVPLGVLATLDPFAALHWLRAGALFAATSALFLAAALRSFPKWGRLVVAGSVLSGSFALFHPSYYFKDVDIHADVTDVVRAEGAVELWSRTEYYQQKYGLGRASVDGERRPMPYPPVIHTLAGWFPFGETRDVLKSSGVLLHALTVALVFALARRLSGSDEAAAAAGLLAALFPESVLELLRASYAALLGHLVDLAIVFLLIRYWSALRSTWGALAFGAAFAISALTYNASPLHLAVFLPLVVAAAVFPPALPGRRGLLTAGAIGAFLSLLYYGRFLVDLASGVGGATAGSPGFAERFRAATVGWDAFGPLYVGLGILGLVELARRRGNDPEGRVALAWAGYALAISVPVFLAPEPLYYFRRLMFVFPLAPVLFAVALFRFRRWLLAATVVLVLMSLHQMSAYVEPFYVTHTGSLARPPS